MSSRIIHAIAPTRICDVGGWTDTHFARYGAVFNIAVYPYVEVQIRTRPRVDTADVLVVHAENFDQTYTLNPDHIVYDKHPLIEAAIKTMGVTADVTYDINLFSHAPPGASMGTSAAVSVALIGALDALTPGHMTPHEVAVKAHALETEELGLECGVQDQLASVYGGINLIEIEEFPRSRVTPIALPDPLWWELEQRLLLAYIGKPHFSSDIHKKVIADLGASPHLDARLSELRELARESKTALEAGDLNRLGAVLNRNTDVQRALHPELVCPDFESIITMANSYEAAGCKVNGAGGDGGSVAILTDGDMRKKRALARALDQAGYQSLPIYLSRRGLRVWENGGLG